MSYILIGELAILALLAVPLGCLLGTGLGRWLMRLFETDMYAFPYVFNPSCYGFAVAFSLARVLIAAALGSALKARRGARRRNRGGDAVRAETMLSLMLIVLVLLGAATVAHPQGGLVFAGVISARGLAVSGLLFDPHRASAAGPHSLPRSTNRQRRLAVWRLGETSAINAISRCLFTAT